MANNNPQKNLTPALHPALAEGIRSFDIGSCLELGACDLRVSVARLRT
jgi:hypothetical protein